MSDADEFNFLLGMGFSVELAQAALAQSETLEEAVGWALENQDKVIGSLASLSRPTAPTEALKMVLVVRDDLGMSAGKVAAQCVHAALGASRQCSQSNPSLVALWERTGETTVCLRCKSDEELERLSTESQLAALTTYIVADAGRTEVESGSRTVLAIGPAEKSRIDAITGTLRLY